MTGLPTKRKRSYDIALLGILASLCLIVSYLEGLLPPFIPVPGVKLGLSNVVVLMALYMLSGKQAFFISFIRIFIAAMLFSGISGLIYSVFGGFFSFFCMFLLKKTSKFGLGGISAAGGVFHNFGQILAAMIMLNSPEIVYYLPVLIVSGIVTGLITGVIAYVSIKHIGAAC